MADLRPGSQALPDGDLRRLMIGRAQVLERLGLADQPGPARWTLRPDAEATLRAMGDRGDIIRTMHRALARGGREPDGGTFAIHGDDQPSVLGRLADRGLQDELKGSAYVVIEGVDGRAHHVRFSSLEATGDATVGAVVEVRPFTGDDGQRRVSLAVRSDLALEAQIKSPGATWLDRTLLAREPIALAEGGFGADVRDALVKRADHLATEGLARRQGARTVFARDLLNELRRREIDAVSAKLSAETGLPRIGSAEGEHVAGVYRQQVQLASGRFAMIDSGLGFELVPWKPALEEHIGRHVSGVVQPGGSGDVELRPDARARTRLIVTRASPLSLRHQPIFLHQTAHPVDVGLDRHPLRDSVADLTVVRGIAETHRVLHAGVLVGRGVRD